MVKALRIIQFILLIAVAAYLLLLHNNNPTNIDMPFFFSLPPALVIGISLLLGFLLGFLPSRLELWRRNREVGKLHKRLNELEQHLPSYAGGNRAQSEPVIPDRTSFFTSSDESAA
jgi:uncharacterized integral membrane protein